jgi:hypothetical protein
MKMLTVHYEKIATALDEVTKQYINIANEYTANGLSQKRYRWDMVKATRILSENNSEFLNELYHYLNDDHIDTALRHYFEHSTKSTT